MENETYIENYAEEGNEIKFEGYQTNEVDNETTEETIEENTVSTVEQINYTEKLDLIHQDLGYIMSVLMFFFLIIALIFIYRFFSMFFRI